MRQSAYPRLRGHLFKRLLLLMALSSALPSCKTSSGEAMVKDSDAVVVSQDELATAYQVLLTDSAAAGSIEQLRAMTFAAYYDAIAANQTSDRVSFAGQVFPPAQLDGGKAKAAFLTLHAAYPTVGAFWDAIGFEPAKAQKADVNSALTMAVDYQKGTGGFDPAAYPQAAAASPETPAPSSSPALGLESPPVSALPSPESLASSIYNCGAGMHDASAIMMSAPNVLCALACQSFWRSVAKCKELMNTTKIIAEKGEALGIIQRRLPFISKYKVLTTAARLGQIGITMAEWMDRFMSAGRAAQATYVREVEPAKEVPRDATDSPSSGSDSRDNAIMPDRPAASDAAPPATDRRGVPGR